MSKVDSIKISNSLDANNSHLVPIAFSAYLFICPDVSAVVNVCATLVI